MLSPVNKMHDGDGDGVVELLELVVMPPPADAGLIQASSLRYTDVHTAGEGAIAPSCRSCKLKFCLDTWLYRPRFIRESDIRTTYHRNPKKCNLAVFVVIFAFGAFAVFLATKRASMIECPTTTQFTGFGLYLAGGIIAAPLRGNIGCVDLGVLSTRPTATVGGASESAQNIYGPFEAGFTSAVPGMSCLGSTEVAGGVDNRGQRNR